MRLVLAAIVTFPLLAGTAWAKPVQSPAAKAVKVGGEAEFDACGAVHKVVGLKKGGDNFLSVRASPSVKGRELDRLRTGRLVWSCDSTEEGEWIGVVYEKRPGQDCGVGTPIAKRRAYAGPCASGWVAGRYLELVAG